jgi:hypothetical protein
MAGSLMAIVEIDDFAHPRDIFDTAYRYVENLVQGSTTSSVYQTYLQMDTGQIPKGKYHLSVCLQPRRNAFLAGIQYRIRQDATTDLFELVEKNYDFDFFQPVIRTFVLDLIAGAYTFDVDYNHFSGGGSAFIDEANIMLWKFDASN